MGGLFVSLDNILHYWLFITIFVSIIIDLAVLNALNDGLLG
jgi:hypothetical protein